MIEKVQRRFIPVPYGCHLHGIFYGYLRISRLFDSEPFFTRRRISDPVLLHYVLSGRIECPDFLSSVSLHAPRGSNRNQLLFYPLLLNSMSPTHRLQLAFTRHYQADIDIFQYIASIKESLDNLLNFSVDFWHAFSYLPMSLVM